MPTVPRTRRVGTNALPGVRLQSAETPLSRGAGAFQAEGEAWQALARVGDTVANVGIHRYGQLKAEEARIAELERRKADDAAVLEATAQLSGWVNDRLHNAESGALTQLGKSAMGLPEQVGAEYDKEVSDIETRLTTPEQRLAFTREKYNRKIDLDTTLQRHVFQQMQRYEENELSKFVENETDAALSNVSDPAFVNDRLNGIIAKITQHAPRAGYGPEQVEALVKGAKTTIHAGVIENLLSSGKDQAAQVYFEEMKSEISGSQIGRIEKALEAGTVQGESQRQSDRITREGGTLTEQREKAKQIEDPKVRAATLELIEHEGLVRDRMEREAQEAAERKIYDHIERTKSIKGVDPIAWSQMDGPARAGARSYAKSLADVGSGGAVKTDYQTFDDLLRMHDSNPDAFAKLNLLRYKNALSMSDYQEFARMQSKIRTGDAGDKAGAGIFADERTQQQMVDEALDRMKIPTTAAEQKKVQGSAERVAAFRRAVREAVDRQRDDKGKIKPEAMQSIVDTLSAQTSSQRMANDGWFWNTYEPARGFEAAQAKVDSVAQIPPAELRAIQASLSKKGIKPTDQLMIRMFNEKLATIRKDR